jgi:hypothetical protein
VPLLFLLLLVMGVIVIDDWLATKEEIIPILSIL